MNLGSPTKKQTDEVLPFISTFNQNNPPAYNAIKNSVEALNCVICRWVILVKCRNNPPAYNSKRQPPNLKKLLIKAEFSNEEEGVRKCQDLRCE